MGRGPDRGPSGVLRATIEGEGWEATEPLLVTVQDGLLAVAGYDRNGRGIALALSASRRQAAQRIGHSVANAIVTIAGYTWSANASDGAGVLRLEWLDERTASGTFYFDARSASASAGQPSLRVTDGRFDVTF